MTGPSTVLLVEDNAELRALLQKELADPHRVRVAANGAEAWTQIQSDPPDLVLCDAEMPGREGPMLCRRIRADADLSSIPILLLGEVGGDGESPVPRTADTVVHKPFSAAELRDQVDRYLPSRELPELPDTGGAFLKKVVQTIERQLHDPSFTVAELAEAMDLSRRHLTRRLRGEADTTPAALIRSRRIERAKCQLEKNPDTVWEVGAAVGFQSASHFSQTFRKEVGCPPSTYRDRHAEAAQR
jgi:YesN/AraC family two-component response regulator